MNSRQEVRKLLYQHRDTCEDLLSQQLAEEKIRRHDLELKIREYECDKKFSVPVEMGETQASNSDYVLLVNSIIQLINKDPVDENVFKIIIRQMTKKS